MNRLKSIWYWLFTEKAVLRFENAALRNTNAALEQEVADLRRDQRTLVNAQLQQAGVVNLPDLTPPRAVTVNRMRRPSLHQAQKQYEYETSPARKAEGKNGQA